MIWKNSKSIYSLQGFKYVLNIYTPKQEIFAWILQAYVFFLYIKNKYFHWGKKDLKEKSGGDGERGTVTAPNSSLIF